MEYGQFLTTKEPKTPDHGVDVEESSIHEILYPFQRAIVRWACKRGRSAIFADCGLGKTFMQIEWARLVSRAPMGPAPSLIVAPLCVSQQTIREGAKIGVPIHDVRSDWSPVAGLNIVNYEMLDNVNPADYGAVVLDESSILKSFTGTTRNKLIKMFDATPFRLCCTATPAPNDVSEVANHAEFLSIMRRVEMLSQWFVNDGSQWRLKGHACGDFYRWMATWAMFVGKPSDLGFDDDGYILPPLNIDADLVPVSLRSPGKLFFTGLKGVQDRAAIRKNTLDARIERCVERINADDEQWIVWCGLNAESERASADIVGAVEVCGSTPTAQKEQTLLDFIDGKVRVLVTKPSIAGFGMNFQTCHNQAFLGLSDSYESYYQCIRRSWRFGQDHPVQIRIILSDVEAEILHNVRRKESESTNLAQKILDEIRGYELEEIGMAKRERDTYREDEWSGDGWQLLRGDCVDALENRIDDESIDFSVFSPPFSQLFTYSNSERDIGNCRDDAEFFAHFAFFCERLLAVTKPGRLAAVHIANVPAMLSRDGFIGVKDLRGSVIRCFQANEWIFHGEVCIDKCPQAQAIRTKSKSLLFVQKERDSSWLRPALADYIVLFRKPGENAVPIQNADVSRDDWIQWARPVWYGIRETDTLQHREAREEKDEKHICPLQLGTIKRCLKLWSNRGDTVLSPFAGIGSEGYVSILEEREFIGVELKESYAELARKNLAAAVRKLKSGTLFGKTEAMS